jgi:hypothetical protein
VFLVEGADPYACDARASPCRDTDFISTYYWWKINYYENGDYLDSKSVCALQSDLIIQFARDE